MAREIPLFLKKVKVTNSERKKIRSCNSNWNKLYAELLVGDRDPEEVLKIMRVEAEQIPPRFGMMERLIGKYIYNQRRVMMAQLEDLKI